MHAISFGQHDTNEVSCILGAELLHDVHTMDLDRPLADAEIFRGLLVRGRGRDLAQHVSLARCQPLAAGEGSRQGIGRIAMDSRIRVHAPIASRTRSTIASASCRFSMKSKAPLLMASTAMGMLP